MTLYIASVLIENPFGGEKHPDFLMPVFLNEKAAKQFGGEGVSVLKVEYPGGDLPIMEVQDPVN